MHNYQATHGQEVTSPGWLKQFVGYDGIKSLVVGREIDAISGATISADAITMNLQRRIRFVRAL
ncbi:MAG: FMN-binding protein [Bacteroidales bacterium]|nr:FMN-binding protein [Bacteroidales bacterium]